MKLAKWEKVLYAVLVVLFLILFVVHLCGVVTEYVSAPTALDFRYERQNGLRYPFVVLCDGGTPRDDSPEQTLAEATTIPSQRGKAALDIVKNWSTQKIKETWKNINLLDDYIKFMGPKCEDLITECKVDDLDFGCCTESKAIVTQFGVCQLIDIPSSIGYNGLEIPTIKIAMKSSDVITVGVADHYAFYYPNAVTLKPADDVQLGVEFLKLYELKTDNRKMERVDPYKSPSNGINEITRFNWHTKKKIGCMMAYAGSPGLNSEEEYKSQYCRKPEQLKYVANHTKDILYDNLRVPKIVRQPQHHFTLFSRASSRTEDGTIRFSLKYESVFQKVARMHYTQTLNGILFRIGATLAMYFTLCVICCLVVKACKCCCCREKGREYDM